MLAIRLQRAGRKGHAQYRVVVQESRLSPTSGRVVASLGSLDPHTKTAVLDKEKAEFYLSNGAQPSDRVAKLFKQEKINLPDWVVVVDNQKRAIRNPDKLRKNQTPEEVTEETPAEEPAVEEEAPAEEPVATEDTPDQKEAEAKE